MGKIFKWSAICILLSPAVFLISWFVYSNMTSHEATKHVKHWSKLGWVDESGPISVQVTRTTNSQDEEEQLQIRLSSSSGQTIQSHRLRQSCRSLVAFRGLAENRPVGEVEAAEKP